MTGALASRRLFAALAPGRRALHLAVHGFALAEHCGAAWPTARENAARSPNPMLLAGLAFAGANRRTAPGAADDGMLTAEEIAAMPLAGVEWVVLSACDTGAGRIADREGILGLRRAFEVAGARTLVTSLWPVDDAHARAWMTAFYTARLVARRDTVEAATLAGQSLLHALRAASGSGHPALWAAFVTSGDWR